MFRIKITVAALLVASLGACEDRPAVTDTVSSKEVREKVADAMNTAADYAKQEKDQYVAQAQKDLDDAKMELAKLKSKAKNATAKGRAELDRDVEAAERKWKTAEEKLGELKAAGEESWKNFRTGVDNAVDDVKQFFRKRA
jgi:hypothetical protein